MIRLPPILVITSIIFSWQKRGEESLAHHIGLIRSCQKLCRLVTACASLHQNPLYWLLLTFFYAKFLCMVQILPACISAPICASLCQITWAENWLAHPLFPTLKNCGPKRGGGAMSLAPISPKKQCFLVPSRVFLSKLAVGSGSGKICCLCVGLSLECHDCLRLLNWIFNIYVRWSMDICAICILHM